jgi:hypothetical protein
MSYTLEYVAPQVSCTENTTHVEMTDDLERNFTMFSSTWNGRNLLTIRQVTAHGYYPMLADDETHATLISEIKMMTCQSIMATNILRIVYKDGLRTGRTIKGISRPYSLEPKNGFFMSINGTNEERVGVLDTSYATKKEEHLKIWGNAFNEKLRDWVPFALLDASLSNLEYTVYQTRNRTTSPRNLTLANGTLVRGSAWTAKTRNKPSKPSPLRTICKPASH